MYQLVHVYGMVWQGAERPTVHIPRNVAHGSGDGVDAERFLMEAAAAKEEAEDMRRQASMDLESARHERVLATTERYGVAGKGGRGMLGFACLRYSQAWGPCGLAGALRHWAAEFPRILLI